MPAAKVSREKLLHCLETVLPGVSKRDIVEQSSAIIFKDGQIFSFDDETACRCPSPLPPDFTGAVPAEKLLNTLRKLPDDELDVSMENGELKFVGKGNRRWLKLRMEAEVTLPIDAVEKPDKWKPLHKDFAEAVSTVQRCAGSDASEFSLTCVHVHPDYVEAADGYQVCRWTLATGMKKATLVRQSAIKSITSLGMSEFSESPTWLHFRSPSKLVLSVRTYAEDYRTDDITGILEEAKGQPAQLPKGLVEAAAIAEEFSKENPEANQVFVELVPGWLRLTGRGVSGEYGEKRKVEYKGRKLSFLISPSMLTDIVKRHNDVELSEERLRVNGGSYVYVACLIPPDDKKAKKEEAEGSEE